jgi:pSer/pThr/pTyr-binding forkhead associated (FHA) protein
MIDYVIIEARRQPQNEVVLTKKIARSQRFSVGRTDASDLVLGDDPELSSVHFLVDVGNDECVVTDHNSTNKTWRDNQPITRAVLQDGDTIRGGRTEFTFRFVSSGDHPRTSNPLFPERSQPKPESTAVPDATPVAEEAGERIVPTFVEPVAPAEPLPSAPLRKGPPDKRSPSPPPASPVRPRRPEATDSGEAIDWSLFVEEPENPGPADESSGGGWLLQSDRPDQLPSLDSRPSLERSDTDPQATQIFKEPSREGRIERVVIAIASPSGKGTEAIVQPQQPAALLAGRVATAQLAVPADHYMSRRHFEVEVVNDRCLLRDLNSVNGTFLNGQQILVAPLAHGDRIRAGQTDFTVSVETGL